MILVDTKIINGNIGRSEIQFRGSEEIIYNDMIMLLKNIKNDKRLQRIFIDASEIVLSGKVKNSILNEEDKSDE